MTKNWLFKIVPFLFILAIGIIGIVPFLKPGFFPTHDGEWMIIRLSDFHRSLADGQWPVRWAGRLNFGYGYPVFNFLYPGTFYFTEFFHLIKFNFTDSVKIAFAVSFLLSGIFMYLFVKEISGRISGILSSILYMFTPYRFVDMYVRGSLGESVAFIFPPLIFLSITKIFQGKKSFFWCGIGALGVMGLITTHNVIAFLFIPVIIVYILLLSIKSNNNKLIVISFLLLVVGFGASSFFWLPALLEKKFTIFDNVVISEISANFPSIIELIKPSWGFGPSRPGDPTSMSFQIGIINILVIISSLIMLVMLNLFQHLKKILKQVQDDNRNIENASFFLAVILIAGFFMTSYSQSVWQYIPGLSLIQFPWRILSVTTFLTAVLSGVLLTILCKKKMIKIIIAICSIAIILWLNLPYVKPGGYINKPDGYYSTNEDTTTVQNEYLPVNAKTLPRQNAGTKVEIIKGKGEIKVIKDKSNELAFTFKGESSQLQINKVYFPGWEVEVNGKKQKISLNNNGVMILSLTDNENEILFQFKETPIRKISDIISVMSLLVIILFIMNKLNIFYLNRLAKRKI